MVGQKNLIEDIIKHYEKNPDLIGYREKKVLNDISELLQLEKDQPGVYTLSGRFGSFQLTWGHPHYPDGTVVG